MHQDHLALILLELVLVLGLSLFGRAGANSFNVPPILGELLIGVLCATIVRLAGGSFEAVTHDLNLFRELGIALLLFHVGLQTDARAMLGVNLSAKKVAAVGAAAPLLLGTFCVYMSLPGGSFTTQLFIGAALAATSVGISAHVFKTLRRATSDEAKLVLRAAAFDYLIGIVLLAVVANFAGQPSLDAVSILKSLGILALFLGNTLWFGERIARVGVNSLEFLEPGRRRFLIPLIGCFIMAWITSELGFTTALGAYMGGLILRDDQYSHEGAPIHEQIGPLASLFASIFIVLLGLQVDFTLLFSHGTGFMLFLTLLVVAIGGKLAVALVVDPKLDGLQVGAGLVPRGEIALIFIAIGKATDILDDELVAAMVAVVVATALLSPPLLKFLVMKQDVNLPPPPPARPD